MRRLIRVFTMTTLLGFCSFSLTFAVEPSSSGDPAKIEFFEKKIRPLLVENCINCHSAENGGRGGLRVDDRNGLIEGGGRGPSILPGKPEQSLLIKAVRHQGLEMPPKKQLTDEQIGELEKWILDGAAWPPVEVPDDLTKPKREYDKLKKEHWSWQPIKDIALPQVANESFIVNDIDRYIVAGLNNAGLQPVRDADKQELIRRVSFDLTGLPPTIDEIARFVDDTTGDAFEKVVDRLLKSPAFGERWARHWLDVARYGESTGSARNIPFPHAWRYRDYAIDSFTSDKPYNQFIREQIAGDLLPANSPAEKAEQLVATGFLALGVKDVNQRFKVRFTMDNIDEQIDTVSRAILGLTASCARCHDHKFDPIPTVDYYALAGIFHSTDLCAGVRSKMGGGGFDYYDTTMLLNVGADSKLSAQAATKIEEQERSIVTIRAEFESIRGKSDGAAIDTNGKSKEENLRQKLNKAEQDLFLLKDPAANGKVAYGVREGKSIGDTEVRIRGEAEKQGPSVPRGFLGLIEIPEVPRVNPNQSGRLELAYWLTSEKNPLSQRVIVNRIWHHLFQQGIVTTVDNFGTTGDRPSHPELLDYLASQFVRGGWSVKKLVRQIVLSHSYRLSAESSVANFAVDPGNRLVWRHNPRRLDAEEIRDGILATSGKLNPGRPDGSAANGFRVVEIQNNGAEAKRLNEATRQSEHRSLFLPLVRGITPRVLEVFDFAEQGFVTGQRDSTTVPTQALYLLNDSFVRRQALAFADRLLKSEPPNDVDRVQLAYNLAFCRNASQFEVDRANHYLDEFESQIRESLAKDAVATSNNATGIEPANVLTVQNDDPAKSSTNQVRSATNGVQSPPVVPPKSDGSPDSEEIEIKDPRTAAWASFCQALLGTAEFRFLK